MFEKYLKELRHSLDIPYPQRSEVIAEISSHLEQLYSESVKEGRSGEEARTRAVAVMAADEEFVGSMEAVHQTAVARALARLPRSVSLASSSGPSGSWAVSCSQRYWQRRHRRSKSSRMVDRS